MRRLAILGLLLALACGQGAEAQMAFPDPKSGSLVDVTIPIKAFSADMNPLYRCVVDYVREGPASTFLQRIQFIVAPTGLYFSDITSTTVKVADFVEGAISATVRLTATQLEDGRAVATGYCNGVEVGSITSAAAVNLEDMIWKAYFYSRDSVGVEHEDFYSEAARIGPINATVWQTSPYGGSPEYVVVPLKAAQASRNWRSWFDWWSAEGSRGPNDYHPPGDLWIYSTSYYEEYIQVDEDGYLYVTLNLRGYGYVPGGAQAHHALVVAPTGFPRWEYRHGEATDPPLPVMTNMDLLEYRDDGPGAALVRVFDSGGAFDVCGGCAAWMTSAGDRWLAKADRASPAAQYQLNIHCLSREGVSAMLAASIGSSPSVVRLEPSDSVMVAYIDGSENVMVNILDPSSPNPYALRGAAIDTGFDGVGTGGMWLAAAGRVGLNYTDLDGAAQTIYSDASGANWTP